MKVGGLGAWRLGVAVVLCLFQPEMESHLKEK